VKMEAKCSFETLVDFQWTKLCHVVEDVSLHNFFCYLSPFSHGPSAQMN
jgi:hypothetical protein